MNRMTVALFTGALVAVLAGSAFAATFSITSARWDGEDRKLSVRGSGTNGATITVTNTQTGAVLGRPRVDSDGQWQPDVSEAGHGAVPVQAAQGSATLQTKRRGRAFFVRGVGRTLSSLAVTGPATVTEGATAATRRRRRSATGPTQNVTATAAWSENSDYATIAAGALTRRRRPFEPGDHRQRLLHRGHRHAQRIAGGDGAGCARAAARHRVARRALHDLRRDGDVPQVP